VPLTFEFFIAKEAKGMRKAEEDLVIIRNGLHLWT
jgi:hypothetical protein